MLRRRITERGFQKAYSVVFYFLIFKQGLTMQSSLAWKSPYNKVDSNLWHFSFPFTVLEFLACVKLHEGKC